MNISEDREPVREYSSDDSRIKNIMAEISFGDEGIHEYLNRISELLESVESKKINSLLNILLYGMLLNDGQEIECIKLVHKDLKKYLEAYYKSLGNVEAYLSENKYIGTDTFPSLVNKLRTDKDFSKKHKKEINKMLKMLPDIKRNLENIAKIILLPQFTNNSVEN